MKNILILGVGRAGKSTLSRMIKDRFPEYDLIHTDSIRNAILYNIDENYIEEFMNYRENEFLQKVLLEFLDSQTKQGLNMYGTILEGAQILPSVLSRYKNVDNTIIIFLGHGNLSEKEIFELVRDNDSKNDWSYKKTDEELKKFIHRFHEKNQFLIGECKKYGFKYIDTHKDREKVLNEVFNYICEEMKN